MSVELVAKNRDVLGLGIANKTWFHLLKKTNIGNVLGRVLTNDPLDVSAEQAQLCAEAMKIFSPPYGWGLMGENGDEKMKQLFIEFFTACNGFTTH
jgi:hypothetical protein